MELVKNKIYFKNLIIMMVVWSFGSFGYFMIPYYLETLNGNVFVFVIATALAEILAAITVFIALKWLNLKVALIVFCLISAGASIFMVFFGNGTGPLVACLMLFANFGVVSTFDVAYLINIELFPTIFLATAYGCCNILGRFISILSPLIARVEHPYPMIILVVYAGISAILAFFLTRVKAKSV